MSFVFNDHKAYAVTETPAPSATPQPANYALRFYPGSVPKVVALPANAALNFGEDMTVEFWVRTADKWSGGANWYDSRWVIDKDVAGSSVPDWAVALKDGAVVVSGGSPTLSGSTDIADGQRHSRCHHAEFCDESPRDLY